MIDLNRRRFLQTASLVVGGSYAHSLFADGSEPAPWFAPKPTFEPTALFLTWQKDPTTTMTVQWVGAEKDAVNRPIWYAREGDTAWRSQPHTARRFPLMKDNVWIFRSELIGLEPGTDYRFRVGLDSAEQRFRTMPARRPTRFILSPAAMPESATIPCRPTMLPPLSPRGRILKSSVFEGRRVGVSENP
jgi:hypothetical protein